MAPRSTRAADAHIDVLLGEPIARIDPNVHGHVVEHLGIRHSAFGIRRPASGVRRSAFPAFCFPIAGCRFPVLGCPSLPYQR